MRHAFTALLVTCVLSACGQTYEDARLGRSGDTVRAADTATDSVGSGDSGADDAITSTDVAGAIDADTAASDVAAADSASDSVNDTVVADVPADAGPPACAPGIPDCCGNSVVDAPVETCDGDCAAHCNDFDPCTVDGQTGASDTCDISCTHTPGDDGDDLDGDQLTDCAEAGDTRVSVDPQRFNGMRVTIGNPPEGFFTSAQCDLFFGDDYSELLTLFDGSTEVMNVWAGWTYDAGNTADYSDASYSFEPVWDDAPNIGVHNSFQALFQARIYLEDAGQYCFSVDTGAGGIGANDIVGRRNSCGRAYINPMSDSGPLAETGYGAGASPQSGCATLAAGWHRLDLATRHYQAGLYSPRFEALWCFGDDQACTPDQPLPAVAMQALDSCAPDCVDRIQGDDGCGGVCVASEPGCGDGVVDDDETCDDGNTITEPWSDSLASDACTADCGVAMPGCGDGSPDLDAGEACDDGNADDVDGCNGACQVPDGDIGAACVAAGIDPDDRDFTAGALSGCDNLPATMGGCERACLRSIDPGFSQPLVYNAGGYCTLMAISCSGALCAAAPSAGDYATCTSCPAGSFLEHTTTNAAGLTIKTKSCLRLCEGDADCRWRQWDARFSEWGRHRCVPATADPGVRVCKDTR